MQIGDWKLQKMIGDTYYFSKDIQNTDVTDDKLGASTRVQVKQVRIRM